MISEDPAAGGTVFRQDPAGIMHLDLGTLVTTPDGRGYGHSWHRAMSDLYLVEGLV